jgi:hypothetical protein
MSTEFTVHSTGLSAKSIGIHRLEISLFIFELNKFQLFFLNSVGFYKPTRGHQFFNLRWFFKHCTELRLPNTIVCSVPPPSQQRWVDRCVVGTRPSQLRIPPRAWWGRSGLSALPPAKA